MSASNEPLLRLVLCCWLVASATSAPASSDWPPGLHPDASVQRVACWDGLPEEPGMICARALMPADPSDPGSGTIAMAVAVLPPVGPVTSPPVVYLEGGPGFGAIVNARDWTDDTLAPLRRGRVVVLPDQRGTGYSLPSLACPEIDRIDYTKTDPTIAATTACVKRLAMRGVDLSDYTSANNAADIARLRRALGIERWDLMGSSYGTRLALTIVRDHPSGVRALALDGLFPPEAEGSGAASSRETVFYALESLVNQCAKDRECTEDIPELRAEIIAAVRLLEKEAKRIDGDVDGILLLEVIMQYLDWPDLPWLIRDVVDGDPTAIDELQEMLEDAGYGYQRQSLRDVISKLGRVERPAAPAGEPAPDVRFDPDFDPGAEAHAMALAILCTEEEPFVTGVSGPVLGWPDDLVSLVDHMGKADAACDALDLPPAPRRETAPVRSDLPALIVNGILDAVTPPAWARLAADGLPNATLVLVPERGHNAVADPCVVGVVKAFLDDPGVPVNPTCVYDLEPLYDE